MKAKAQSRAAAKVRRGICVIGAGNWGSSLAAAVAASEVPLVEVVGRKASARRFGDVPVTSFRKAVFNAEVLWICVPDGETSGVAKAIVAQRADLRGQVVLHSSGALTAAVLDSAKQVGARTAGVAPVFSFPTREPVSLAGVMFAVESAVSLRRKLVALVNRLGGRSFGIAAEKKVLYHAAATMASPLLVSALDAAVQIVRLAGLTAEDAKAVVAVLANTTLRNYLERGNGASFSGAFARGDVATVELHLQALLAHPTHSEVYIALARNAVLSLPVQKKRQFEQLLGNAGLPGDA